MLSSVMMGFATDSCASGTPCDSGLANAGMAVGFFDALAIAVAVIVALLFKSDSAGSTHGSPGPESV
jgi:hypothetical protein